MQIMKKLKLKVYMKKKEKPVKGSPVSKDEPIIKAHRRCGVCHFFINNPDYLIHDGNRIRHSCPGKCDKYEQCKYDRGHPNEVKQKKRRIEAIKRKRKITYY